MEFSGIKKFFEQQYGARQLQPGNLDSLGRKMNEQLASLKMINSGSELPQGILKARLNAGQFGQAVES